MINWPRIGRYALRTSIVCLLSLLAIALLITITDPEVDFGSWQFTNWKFVRGFLPFLLAMAAVWGALVPQFVKELYDLDSRKEGWIFLRRRIFGRMGRSPWIMAKEGQLMTTDTLRNIGGAGSALTAPDSAIVTERLGTLHRVIAPKPDTIGLYDLDDFERPWDVVDLRPQHWKYQVSALSREGIPIKCTVDLHYRLAQLNEESTPTRPFPVHPDTVFLAATNRWMRDINNSQDDQSFDWAHRIAISDVEGALRGILARYPLDELIGLTNVSPLPRNAIRDELKSKLTHPVSGVGRYGAEIIELHLGEIHVDDKVLDQWIDAWQVDWHKEHIHAEADAEAQRIRLLKRAKSLTQATLITKIADGLDGLDDEELSDRVIIAKLMQVIEEYEQELYQFLPNTAYQAIKDWKDLLGASSPIP